MMRRAEVADARECLAAQPLIQRGLQARLADARLAGDQHHAPLAGFRLRPAPKQQLEFLLAADQRGQPGCAQRLEAA